MNSLVSFIILIGVLIFVHELGHFLTGKLLGVKVLTFSLGFPPRQSWTGTEPARALARLRRPPRSESRSCLRVRHSWPAHNALVETYRFTPA